MIESSLAYRLQRSFASFGDPSADATSDLLTDYADDAVFEDPFQVVRGKAGIEKAFRAMVGASRAIRIVTSDLVESNERIWFAWRFDFTPKRGPTLVIEGATLFRIRGGRVVHHRDYWDTVETLGLSMPGLKAVAKGLIRLAG